MPCETSDLARMSDPVSVAMPTPPLDNRIRCVEDTRIPGSCLAWKVARPRVTLVAWVPPHESGISRARNGHRPAGRRGPDDRPRPRRGALRAGDPGSLFQARVVPDRTE